MYEHQDWKPVVFKVKKEGNGKDEKSIRQAQQLGRQIDTQVRKIIKEKGAGSIVSIAKLDDNGEVFAHKKVDKQMADAIKNKRIELKMTQAVLAQRINEKPNVIQEIETMKSIYNHVMINKVLRSLGLTLKDVRSS